jgi:hypothetical protein
MELGIEKGGKREEKEFFIYNPTMPLAYSHY